MGKSSITKLRAKVIRVVTLAVGNQLLPSPHPTTKSRFFPGWREPAATRPQARSQQSLHLSPHLDP
jgi:hypothetical protein